jgi:DNA-directed RNA polymerase subunit RPC12/RpoP
MLSLDDAVKVAKSLVAGGKDDDAIIRQEMVQKCRNDDWRQQTVSAVAEMMNKVISGINSTEICNQIASDNLRKWCERTQCELRIAMNYLPYQGKALSSAQPEQKKGRWIVIVKGCKLTSYKCSECGRYIADDTGHDVKEDYPFCHCGADMREDTNE